MKQEAKHHWRGCSEQTRALCTAPRREDTAHQIWYQIFKHCSPPWAVHCTEHTLHGAVEKLLSKPQLPAKIPSNPAHPKGLLSHLVLFSLNYSNPAPFHIQPPLIYLFLLICTEDCGSPWSLEQVELCRLQIKHCVYLHFFRRFTISFYTDPSKATEFNGMCYYMGKTELRLLALPCSCHQDISYSLMPSKYHRLG